MLVVRPLAHPCWRGSRGHKLPGPFSEASSGVHVPIEAALLVGARVVVRILGIE